MLRLDFCEFNGISVAKKNSKFQSCFWTGRWLCGVQGIVGEEDSRILHCEPFDHPIHHTNV